MLKSRSPRESKVGLTALDDASLQLEADLTCPLTASTQAKLWRFGSSRLVWGDEPLAFLLEAGMKERTSPASDDARIVLPSQISAAVAGRDP